VSAQRVEHDCTQRRTRPPSPLAPSSAPLPLHRCCCSTKWADFSFDTEQSGSSALTAVGPDTIRYPPGSRLSSHGFPTRVAIEKPVGRDEMAAHTITGMADAVVRWVVEEGLGGGGGVPPSATHSPLAPSVMCRAQTQGEFTLLVDHYLGKTAVDMVVGLRKRMLTGANDWSRIAGSATMTEIVMVEDEDLKGEVVRV
jgi:hypothetical protein